MSLSGQQPTLSQGNNSRTSHHPTSLKVRKNTKLKQSLTRRSSGTESSTGPSERDMRRQLGNLQIILDKQEMQSKTLSNVTWEAISLLTDMAMTAKLGRKTRPMAYAFMNFYDKKFNLVLRNVPAQRDRSMQTVRVQDRRIQDLRPCKELGLANALKPTAMEMDEQHLDRDVIDLTGNTDEEHTRARTHGSDPRVVQEGGDVMPPPQKSVNNGPSLFNYGLDNPYNDLIDDFDPYLEYGKGYQNRTAFKDAFYR